MFIPVCVGIVCSAHAEMIPITIPLSASRIRLLRTRGDDPLMAQGLEEIDFVCSAHAEMIPVRADGELGFPRLLRTRGDDPKRLKVGVDFWKSAPHTRR